MCDVSRRFDQSRTSKRLVSNGRPDIDVFPQFVSLRLTPEGQLFTEADGTNSPYAPGHGDLTFALRKSGMLEKFRSAGGRILMMSNVDNLGATLDPALVADRSKLEGARSRRRVQGCSIRVARFEVSRPYAPWYAIWGALRRIGAKHQFLQL